MVDAGTLLDELFARRRLSIRDGEAMPPVLKWMLVDATLLPQSSRRYSLNHAYPPLDAAQIQRLRANPAADLTVLAAVDSTQERARQLLHERRRPQIVLAEAQLAGRGRMGRSFLTAPLCSLAFSYAAHIARPLGQSQGLAPAVGAVLGQVLRRFKPTVAVKWPNDFLVGRAKLGGVLIEAHADGDGTIVVIGVGLNILPFTSLLTVDRRTASLFSIVEGRDQRHRVAAALFDALEPAVDRFAEAGFPAFQELYQQHDALFGQQVRVEERGQVRYGRASGLDARGGLRVATEEGPIVVVSGEAEARINPV